MAEQKAALCISRFLRRVHTCPITLMAIPFDDLTYIESDGKWHAYSLSGLLMHFETQVKAQAKPTFPLTRKVCKSNVLLSLCNRKYTGFIQNMFGSFLNIQQWLSTYNYSYVDSSADADAVAANTTNQANPAIQYTEHYFEACNLLLHLLTRTEDVSQKGILMNFLIRMSLAKSHPIFGTFRT